MQLAVWRPEQLSPETLNIKDAALHVHSVLLPLEFCLGVHDCKVLTQTADSCEISREEENEKVEG